METQLVAAHFDPGMIAAACAATSDINESWSVYAQKAGGVMK
jgi:hypothetical protein